MQQAFDGFAIVIPPLLRDMELAHEFHWTEADCENTTEWWKARAWEYLQARRKAEAAKYSNGSPGREPEERPVFEVPGFPTFDPARPESLFDD